ncbi:MAG: BlaI/MecI/CopY family transcriptional regulator [Oscillospiraceae bacterium]
METNRLCDSEYRFAQVVWETAPVGSGRLAELCRERLGWKKSTTYTTLKKLCDRGLLQNENAVVTVVVPREQVTAAVSADFVERTFDGSLPGFVAAFLGGKTLSANEAAELKRLIDDNQREEGLC